VGQPVERGRGKQGFSEGLWPLRPVAIAGVRARGQQSSGCRGCGVLAATNRDLRAAVAHGSFRQDLYYRLNVFPIGVPPLRERVDDIPVLLEYLVERYARKAGKSIRNIKKHTVALFQAYDWPGNVRELQNVRAGGLPS
jgi:transcriptional regulator with GAF, ATPase, and Fis domain